MITPLNLLTVFTGMKTAQKNRKDAILAADLELRNRIKSTAYEYKLKADIEKLKADIASSADNADMFSEKLVYENSENPSMNYNFGIPKFFTGDEKASLEKEAEAGMKFFNQNMDTITKIFAGTNDAHKKAVINHLIPAQSLWMRSNNYIENGKEFRGNLATVAPTMASNALGKEFLKFSTTPIDDLQGFMTAATEAAKSISLNTGVSQNNLSVIIEQNENGQTVANATVHKDANTATVMQQVKTFATDFVSNEQAKNPRFLIQYKDIPDFTGADKTSTAVDHENFLVKAYNLYEKIPGLEGKAFFQAMHETIDPNAKNNIDLSETEMLNFKNIAQASYIQIGDVVDAIAPFVNSKLYNEKYFTETSAGLFKSITDRNLGDARIGLEGAAAVRKTMSAIINLMSPEEFNAWLDANPRDAYLFRDYDAEGRQTTRMTGQSLRITGNLAALPENFRNLYKTALDFYNAYKGVEKPEDIGNDYYFGQEQGFLDIYENNPNSELVAEAAKKHGQSVKEFIKQEEIAREKIKARLVKINKLDQVNAQAGFLTYTLAYQYASFLQGGTGGRTISDQDIENMLNMFNQKGFTTIGGSLSGFAQALKLTHNASGLLRHLNSTDPQKFVAATWIYQNFKDEFEPTADRAFREYMDLSLGTGVGTLGSKVKDDKTTKAETETPSAFVVLVEGDPILKANPNLKVGQRIPASEYNKMLKGSQQTSTTGGNIDKTYKLELDREGIEKRLKEKGGYEKIINMLGLNEMSDSMGEEGLIKFLLDNKDKELIVNKDGMYGGFVGE